MGDDGGRQFIAFVHKLRKQQNYTLEQVCEGICSPGTIHSMENGKWKSDKLVRNHILDRLGVGAEDYEHFLDVAEYNRWEIRHRILHCITFGEPGKAGELLEEYKKTYDMGNNLEKQFCLGMEVQIQRRLGCPKEELSALLEEAAALTVLELSHKPLEQLALSVRELNLILEAEQYRREGERAGQYRKIVAYIDQKQWDGMARAKIYPKAVYFLCRCLLTEQGVEGTGQDLEALLQYCECAIEILRDNARMYYLWELLELEKQLVSSMAKHYILEGRQKKADELKEWYQKREGWKQALEAVYAEYGVNKETTDFCYLYVEKGCYCVNDVIRTRRKMLGMSRQKLCQGICDEKTLKRLEQGKTKPQWTIVENLLERLTLPTDFMRTELITASPEARELMRQLRTSFDHGLWDQALVLQEHIKKLVPLDIKCNQQVLGNNELLYRWKKGELGDEAYYRDMMSMLELTLPYEAFLKEGEKYLTNEEQTCIQNLMLAMDKNGEEYMLCMQRFEEIYQPYIEKGLLETISNMYEFVMCNIGSAWGNRGEYDRSDQYSNIIIKGCLCTHRLEVIKACLYNRWWNYDKRKSLGIPNNMTLDDKEELTKCIMFADMTKDNKRIQFFENKLKQIKEDAEVF